MATSSATMAITSSTRSPTTPATVRRASNTRTWSSPSPSPARAPTVRRAWRLMRKGRRKRAMADNTRTIEIEVLRYRPEQDKEPFYQTHSVPFADDWSVLQGLQYIKDDLDSSLSFRWSCRMAICGSCGMMIDGKPRLACRTFLRHYHPNKLRVGPLEPVT